MTGNGTVGHTKTFTGLLDEQFKYYIRCEDTSGNKLGTDVLFDVDTRGNYNITRPQEWNAIGNYWTAANSFWKFTLPTFDLNITSLTSYNVTTVLASVDGNYDHLYAWNMTSYKSYVPGRVVNTFADFNVSSVDVIYYIHMNTTDRLEIN